MSKRVLETTTNGINLNETSIPTGLSAVSPEYQVYLCNFCRNTFYNNFTHQISSPVTQKDFVFIRTLGIGGYGRVFLAQDKQTRNSFAVKVLDKDLIIEKKAVQQIKNEKDIMGSIRFPFVIFSYAFFQDNGYIYFVEPLMDGGDLLIQIQKNESIEESQGKFIAAQIVLGLEYLHSIQLIHRDIKPENIAFQNDGFLKIIDVGFGKCVSGRTYTICGTPGYIAPEILTNTGYGASVDWWSFGVLLYEMSSGTLPFTGVDDIETYRMSLGTVKLFSYFSIDLKDLLKKLIVVDLTSRYGTLLNSVSRLKLHPWFHEINWDDILHKRMKMPFIPERLITKSKFDETPLNIGRKKNKYKEIFNDF